MSNTTTFLKPRYDQGGFASLPGRITGELTAQKYDAVILVLLDGFGWRFVEKFQQEPFLLHAATAGKVEKITSQFPSTTSVHVTTIHTGMPVGEHAVLEWNYYEPGLDMVITPLLFSRAGESMRDTLLELGVRPRRLLPKNTFYSPLKKQGIHTTIFQHREYTPSTYSDVVFAGAEMKGYKTLPEALVNLGDELERSASPAYLFLYYDRIDSISHQYGPAADQTTHEIRMTLAALQQVLLPILQKSHKKVLLHLTADHGQTETDPATAIYINREPRFAGVEKFLRTDRQGQPLIAAGSARDFFLYIKDDAIDEARHFLASRLEGQAEVRKVADLIDEGYFGTRIDPKFRPRAGDLVILPYRRESVWWYVKNKFEQRFYGHHGGLTADELEIPLLTWEM